MLLPFLTFVSDRPGQQSPGMERQTLYKSLRHRNWENLLGSDHTFFKGINEL